MLGTAARNSITAETGPASQAGASSDRNTATPSPTGTVSSMATPVVTTVPTIKMPAPYWLAAGFQVSDQMKPRPAWANAWADPVASDTTRATTARAKTVAAAQYSPG